MLSVAQAPAQERAGFIRKTYVHVAGAVLAFALVEYILFQTGIADVIAAAIFSSGRIGWLVVMGAFSLIGWMARGLTAKADNENLQYTGLGIYILVQAFLFVPLIAQAQLFPNTENILTTAAGLTLAMFGGLTMIAFTTKKDFSFLGGFLRIGGFVALGVMVCGALFGFNLGLFFSAAMVAFASMAILYDTSKVMKHYSTRHHVAASLELFASVALLFWYVLRIVMSMSRR